MYFEKMATADITILILMIAVLLMAFLYLKSKIDCIRKDRRIKGQLKELEKQASQIENLTALYNHALNYDKSKTEFFTGITHELKTPVSVILGAIQLLSLKTSLPQEENPTLAKNLKVIRSNCFRLLRLVNNLLDFSRADAGYLKFDPANCNIVSAVEEIIQSVIPYAQQKQISLEFNKNAGEIITAVDVEKLERILLNLLSNAIKFTPSGGRISVALSSFNGKVCISVKDTGIGIPLEKQKVIFERFIQVNSSLSKEQEGSGIGLWLVKAFVELHGGNILLSSEPGKGSEFIVELPQKTIEGTCGNQALQGFRQDTLLQAADMEFTTITNM